MVVVFLLSALQRSYGRCEVAPHTHPPLLPSVPHRSLRDAANRSGDFGWFRGETRDQSKAETRGLLPSVLLP